MASTKRQVPIRFHDDVELVLRDYARDNGLSIALIVNIALRQYLKIGAPYAPTPATKPPASPDAGALDFD